MVKIVDVTDSGDEDLGDSSEVDEGRTWLKTLATPFTYVWERLSTPSPYNPIRPVAREVMLSSYDGINASLAAGQAVLPTARAIVKEQEVQHSLYNFGRYVGFDDYLPMFLVMVVAGGCSYYLAQDDDEFGYLSATMFISMSLQLINIAKNIFKVYKSTSSEPRAMIAGNRISTSFVNASAQKVDMSLLSKEAQLSDPIPYLARYLINKCAIAGLAYLNPRLGWWFNSNHEGQLILRAPLTNMSEADKARYVAEYSMYALVLGLSKEVVAESIGQFIEWLTLLPRQYTVPFLSSLSTVIWFGLAANMVKPQALPKEQCTRLSHYLNPSEVLDKTSLKAAEWLAAGYVLIPKWLGSDEKFQWKKFKQQARGVLQNSYLKAFKHYCLPKMYHSAEDFMQDPIYKENAETIVTTLLRIVRICKMVRDCDKELRDKVKKELNKKVSKVAGYVFGKIPDKTLQGLEKKLLEHPKAVTMVTELTELELPYPLVEFLFELVLDPLFMQDLDAYEHWASRLGKEDEAITGMENKRMEAARVGDETADRSPVVMGESKNINLSDDGRRIVTPSANLEDNFSSSEAESRPVIPPVVDESLGEEEVVPSRGLDAYF